MNKIKYKIQGYDEISHSIIVSYCSDETATNNPDDYTGFALQPLKTYPDVTDMEELKKKIALEGIGLAEQVKQEEVAKANTTMQEKWKALVGQTFEYNVSDVLNIDSDTEVHYSNEVVVPPVAE
jgi:hypothetical protein